jgi:hypothetical protein
LFFAVRFAFVLPEHIKVLAWNSPMEMGYVLQIYRYSCSSTKYAPNFASISALVFVIFRKVANEKKIGLLVFYLLIFVFLCAFSQ